MLEKPSIPDETLLSGAQAAYGLPLAGLDFLPLGADLNTAVYRAETQAGAAFFLKLRLGNFDATSVTLPAFLAGQGIRHVIAPLPTRDGLLWAETGYGRLILYPFINGHDAYQAALSPTGWRAFGETVRAIHDATARAPAGLLAHMPREAFAAPGLDTLERLLPLGEAGPYVDEIAAGAGATLRAEAANLRHLLARTRYFRQDLFARSLPFVLCHADLHAGNLLITPGGDFYIIDWDTALLAPRERDLMFIGSGLGFAGLSAPNEPPLFYPGYGDNGIDAAALAYYRYARIVEDLAIFCEQLLRGPAGGDDRAQALRWMRANFLPGGTLDMARAADR